MAKRGKPEITEVLFYNDHLKIRWICKNCGFGELDIYDRHHSTEPIQLLDVYTECMGEDFYKEILASLNKFLLKKATIKG